MSLIARYPLLTEFNNKNIITDYVGTAKGGDFTDKSVGKFGESYTWDGNAYKYIQIEKCSDLFDNGDSFSLSIWVNLSSELSKRPALDQRTGFFSSNQYNSDGIGLGCHGLTPWFFVMYSGGGCQLASSIPLTFDEWHLVTGTYDKDTMTAKIFIDNKFGGSQVLSSPWLVTTRNMIIGENNQGGWTNTFIGNLQDARIYDHALSIKEINDLNNACMADYEFDDFHYFNDFIPYDSTYINPKKIKKLYKLDSLTKDNSICNLYGSEVSGNNIRFSFHQWGWTWPASKYYFCNNNNIFNLKVNHKYAIIVKCKKIPYNFQYFSYFGIQDKNSNYTEFSVNSQKIDKYIFNIFTCTKELNSVGFFQLTASNILLEKTNFLINNFCLIDLDNIENITNEKLYNLLKNDINNLFQNKTIGTNKLKFNFKSKSIFSSLIGDQTNYIISNPNSETNIDITVGDKQLCYRWNDGNLPKLNFNMKKDRKYIYLIKFSKKVIIGSQNHYLTTYLKDENYNNIQILTGVSVDTDECTYLYNYFQCKVTDTISWITCQDCSGTVINKTTCPIDGYCIIDISGMDNIPNDNYNDTLIKFMNKYQRNFNELIKGNKIDYRMTPVSLLGKQNIPFLCDRKIYSGLSTFCLNDGSFNAEWVEYLKNDKRIKIHANHKYYIHVTRTVPIDILNLDFVYDYPYFRSTTGKESTSNPKVGFVNANKYFAASIIDCKEDDIVQTAVMKAYYTSYPAGTVLFKNAIVLDLTELGDDNLTINEIYDKYFYLVDDIAAGPACGTCSFKLITYPSNLFDIRKFNIIGEPSNTSYEINDKRIKLVLNNDIATSTYETLYLDFCIKNIDLFFNRSISLYADISGTGNPSNRRCNLRFYSKPGMDKANLLASASPELSGNSEIGLATQFKIPVGTNHIVAFFTITSGSPEKKDATAIFDNIKLSLDNDSLITEANYNKANLIKSFIINSNRKDNYYYNNYNTGDVFELITDNTLNTLPEFNKDNSSSYIEYISYDNKSDYDSIDDNYKVFDSSGFDHHGTPNNILYKNDTCIGSQSVWFNGVNSQIISPVNTNGKTNFSVEAWINIDKYRGRAGIVQGGIFFTISSGYLALYAYGKTPAGYHTGKTKIPLNTWVHVAAVWDDTSVKGYVNGKEDINVLCNGIMTNGANKEIGGNHVWFPFSGQIAQIKMYGNPLSADDIKNHAKSKMSIDKFGNYYANTLDESGTELCTNGLELIENKVQYLDNDISTYNISGYTWASNESKYDMEIKDGYKYILDFNVNNTVGNHLYIGFDRFDDKYTWTRNGSCFYSLISTKELNNYHLYEDITEDLKRPLDTYNSNPGKPKYFRIRILNNWDNVNDPNLISIIQPSILEIPVNVKPGVNKKQILKSGFIKSSNNKKAKIYKNGIVEGNSFIER